MKDGVFGVKNAVTRSRNYIISPEPHVPTLTVGMLVVSVVCSGQQCTT